LTLFSVSAALAVVEQIGDLAESALKRRFGVKDSGTIIPGHGGMLDRLDGMLAVLPAVAAMILFGNGIPGWR
jgi:phosphatidate cytidylyltransferase